ncbi:MAG: pinR, partial [Nitrospira sp.]|nr:pinR [Nitrospira sp.]
EASIEDQCRNCEAYAARQGWHICQRYQDKGISGTKDETGREGYAAMLRAARADEFDVLLVDDLSRLSRDSMKTEEVRRLFVYLGIRLIGISDGIDTTNKGHKALSGFKGLMNDIFLDDLREKTHRGLMGQALKGNNCGGRVYGYQHVPVYHSADKDEYGRPKILAVRREIDESQAQWVRQVFSWYAEGRSPRDIADELNRRQIPAPGAAYRRKQRTSRYGTWSASVFHGDLQHATGMLNNPIYIGRVIWNRREWVTNPETKRRVPRMRPESQWVTTEQPELRIIPQALWDQVQERRKALALGQLKHPGVRRGRGPKYLFSGLLKCGECDSNFVMSDYYRYACGGNINRGKSVCTNGLRVPRKLVEDRCLEHLRADLFSPEGLQIFIEETTRLLALRNREREPQLEKIKYQLNRIETEITNILKAIRQGILTPSTKLELERAEAERLKLQDLLNGKAAKVDKVVTLLPRAAERYRAVVENLGALSAKHMYQAREQIRLLVGEIRLIPTEKGYLEAELRGRYEGLYKLVVGGQLKNLVAGRGFEPLTFNLVAGRGFEPLTFGL